MQSCMEVHTEVRPAARLVELDLLVWLAVCRRVGGAVLNRKSKNTLSLPRHCL